jgi:hypothetical protein
MKHDRRPRRHAPRPPPRERVGEATNPTGGEGNDRALPSVIASGAKQSSGWTWGTNSRLAGTLPREACHDLRCSASRASYTHSARALLPPAGDGARQRREDEGVPRKRLASSRLRRTPSAVMLRMPPSPASGRRGRALCSLAPHNGVADRTHLLRRAALGRALRSNAATRSPAGVAGLFAMASRGAR